MQNLVRTTTLINNLETSFSTDEVLSKTKVVGLYFSASYCPPCHKFTPILAKVYSELKELGLEIILIPSDKTQEAFDGYFKTHPWLSIPFDNNLQGENSSIASSIRAEMNVKSIPTLIFFDTKGNVICREGRLLVQNETLDEIVQKLGFYQNSQ